jgi:maleylpyruvate isomerase
MARYPEVKFVGAKFNDDLAAHYACADVFVFPSLTDTFGLVILEAWGAGTPVAAFSAPGPVDIIPGTGAGVVAPGRTDGLREACLEALKIDRAHVRAMAAIIGCDIHPLNNRRVLEYLRHTLGCDEAAVLAWCGTWIKSGFEALETLLIADAQRGNFCFGHAPTLADAYLVAQVESARRFKVDLGPYPNIVAIDQACAKLPAFERAAPKNQPDAV